MTTLASPNLADHAIAQMKARAATARYTPTLVIDNARRSAHYYLSRAEEVAVFARLRSLEEQSPAWRELRDLIVVHNLPLVLKFVGTDPDLLGAAEDGLLRAIELFDHTRGLRLSTYAVNSLRQRAWREQAVRTRRHSHTISATDLQGRRDSGERNLNPLERRGTTDADLGRMERAENMAAVRRALLRLPWREREILRRRFYGAQTLAEAGQAVGVTKERVRQVQNIALRKLREILEGREDAA